MRLFIDMDGVIVDFVEGVRRWYECDDWNPTQWDIDFELLGTTRDEFWESLNNNSFWLGCPYHKEAMSLIKIFNGYDPNWCILSSAPMANCFAGKALWIQKNLPDIYNQGRFYLCRRNKYFLAHPEAVLVDDHEGNYNEWVKYGGKAILVPRPWNYLKYLEPYLVEYIRSHFIVR